MTRNDIEQGVYRWLNKETGSPNSATQTRIRAFVNAEVREVLSLSGMERLRPVTATFASVANQPQYGLPLEFAKVSRIVDQDNYARLFERDVDWLRSVQPNPDTSSSTPAAYVPYGYQAVQLQPSNASELFAKSSGADTTQTVYVEGFVTGGLPRIASVVLNGTTAVSLSASITTWEVVTKFYVSAVGVGVISLHEDSGAGTTLAQLAIGKTSSRYQAIILWPTPSSVRTYHIDGYAALNDLAQDTDVPPCPEDFHELFVYGACYRECIKTDDPRTASFKQLRDEKLRALKGWLNASASTRIVPGMSEMGWSNLGGFYPADGRLCWVDVTSRSGSRMCAGSTSAIRRSRCRRTLRRRVTTWNCAAIHSGGGGRRARRSI
jgi:hypothetical protein